MNILKVKRLVPYSSLKSVQEARKLQKSFQFDKALVSHHFVVHPHTPVCDATVHGACAHILKWQTTEKKTHMMMMMMSAIKELSTVSHKPQTFDLSCNHMSLENFSCVAPITVCVAHETTVPVSSLHAIFLCVYCPLYFTFSLTFLFEDKFILRKKHTVHSIHLKSWWLHIKLFSNLILNCIVVKSNFLKMYFFFITLKIKFSLWAEK